VDAVRSDRLVQDAVRIVRDDLLIGDLSIPLGRVGRIAVVGCGKAGAGMAAGLMAALGDRILAEKQVTGWINVPDDCVCELPRIHLHGARPPGVNEPTAAGVAGAGRILELVRGLATDDLCICLISGGGSALLPAPVDGITLEDKLAVTRHLSGAGANIQQLNTVRKQLSRIKGGRLARECHAGRLIALIISDVLGDPLDVIASGPTVPDTSTPAEALVVLQKFQAREAGISDAVFEYLARVALQDSGVPKTETPKVTNQIIGNNATAVRASAQEARRRGYETRWDAAQQLEGDAEALGQRLADTACAMRRAGQAACLVSGGEPTVRLVPSGERGLGGRNQQLVLAALEHLLSQPVHEPGSGSFFGGNSQTLAETSTPKNVPDPLSFQGRQRSSWEGLPPPTESFDGLVMLSGGTDGEDGPTDAAGAWLDATLLEPMRAAGLQPETYLRRNDAYHFFDSLNALIRTGPTHTNVCDLRIVLTDETS